MKLFHTVFKVVIFVIPDWVDESNLAQFPEELQFIAETIGFDNLLKLMDIYQSTEFYIPKLENVSRTIRNKQICKEFDGKNHLALAQKYRLSPRQIYNIISNKKEKRKGTQ